MFKIDAFSSLTAGFLTTLLLHPVDTIASRIMTGRIKHRQMIQAFQSVIKNEGFSSLYLGVIPS